MESSKVNKEEFQKLLLNDKYIKWLYKFMEENGGFDDVYFVKESRLSSEDRLMIKYLKYLYYELMKCFIKTIGIFDEDLCLTLNYNNCSYGLSYDGICFSCDKYSCSLVGIKYEDLKKQYTIEDKAKINNIEFTSLSELLNKVLDTPEEFYKEIYYQLPVEERHFIRKNLENKSCATCLNGSCRVESYEKVGLDENGKPQGSECIGWTNEVLVGKSKVLKISDVHKLKI